jgi:hypothetical protein
MTIEEMRARILSDESFKLALVAVIKEMLKNN